MIQRQSRGACSQELPPSRGVVDVLERGRFGCGNVDNGGVWKLIMQRGEYVRRRASQNANAQTEAAGGHSGISDAATQPPAPIGEQIARGVPNGDKLRRSL